MGLCRKAAGKTVQSQTICSSEIQGADVMSGPGALFSVILSWGKALVTLLEKKKKIHPTLIIQWKGPAKPLSFLWDEDGYVLFRWTSQERPTPGHAPRGLIRFLIPWLLRRVLHGPFTQFSLRSLLWSSNPRPASSPTSNPALGGSFSCVITEHVQWKIPSAACVRRCVLSQEPSGFLGRVLPRPGTSVQWSSTFTPPPGGPPVYQPCLIITGLLLDEILQNSSAFLISHVKTRKPKDAHIQQMARISNHSPPWVYGSLWDSAWQTLYWFHNDRVTVWTI